MTAAADQDAALPPEPPRRLLLPTSRAGLRVSWHDDRGVVLSLWHDNVCAASAPLPPADAGRLSRFLHDHLRRAAVEATCAAPRADATRPGGSTGSAPADGTWRGSFGDARRLTLAAAAAAVGGVEHRLGRLRAALAARAQRIPAIADGERRR